MKKILYRSVGSVLVLAMTSAVVSPAFAQDLTPPPAARMGATTPPTAATRTTGATTSGMSPEEVAETYRFAQQNGLAPFTMTPNDLDAFGRPRSIPSVDAARVLGSIDAVRMAQRDDANHCGLLNEMKSIEMEIKVAEALVLELDAKAEVAQTKAEQKQARAQASRARTNFMQLLLTGLRVGVVSMIPGVGWAYGAYVLGSEWSAWLSRHQQNIELEAHDARVDADSARVRAFAARMKEMNLRMKLSDMHNELYRFSMGNWCEANGYTVRSTTSSATMTH